LLISFWDIFGRLIQTSFTSIDQAIFGAFIAVKELRSCREGIPTFRAAFFGGIAI